MLTSVEDNKPQLVSPRGRRLSQIAQQTSPVVFPEKRSKKTKSKSKSKSKNPDQKLNDKPEEIRINIEENSGLLGGALITGKLTWDKRKNPNANPNTEITTNQPIFASKLTNKALTWGSNTLHLSDIISVTYNINVRYFTIHAYPLQSLSPFNCFTKPKKIRRDFRFIASTVDDAVQWVGAFADHHCYINCLPHPPPELIFRCKTAPKMLVVLNPRSGRGRSVKVFERVAEPILKLAGFNLEVVKTTRAGHARELAASVDIATCPDGIICVGGDGIINEVLNGLLSRENQKEGISIPIGIVPAGSDNSLVWTVLGVRDPAAAAISIVKGGLTATDVFAVEWIETGVRHFGMTVSYYGFVSDVLEQCEKYQKRFGPLRYFVAGFLKFLCLPNYNYEVEFQLQNIEDKTDKEVVDVAEIYTDYMGRSPDAALPRASSLSSIDSATTAGSEPSEYVRAIDPKVKRLSSGKTSQNSEPEVIHPQVQFSATPNWPRTRSKSRTEKGWSGQTVAQNQGINDDISSTLSDPGPIWDAEPKWEPEESSIELPGPTGLDRREVFPRFDEKWEFRKGMFLGILVCNHACRTVQSSQVVAPRARPDDYSMDLILVHGSGRFRLLRFFLLLQMGRHTTLPFVEYVKVKGVKVKALKNTHNGCGIDGELFSLDGQVRSFLLPEQCRLIGRPPQ